MKKLLSIVVIAAAFTLVGCSSKGTTAVADTGFAQQKEIDKGKTSKHHHGKLGIEQTTDDTSK